MRSGRKTLHWNTPEPASVHRHHEDPSTSDGLHMILRIAAEPIGADDIRAGDFNLQAWWSRRHRAWVIGGAHWRDPYRNGYRRMKRRLLPGSRRMTREELHRREWTWEGARRWRRPNGERVLTIDQLHAAGALHGVVVIGELKHRVFHQAAVARQLVASARRHDHPAWSMVLVDMAPRGKVAAMRKAGGQIALILGRDPSPAEKPKDWSEWTVHPNRIWGPAWARRWLPKES